MINLPSPEFANWLERQARRIRESLAVIDPGGLNQLRRRQLAAIENLRALAALYRHCDRPYQNVEECAGAGRPLNGWNYPKGVLSKASYNSPAASCVEQ